MLVEVVEGWLTRPYDYEPPRRGQMLRGTIVKIEEHEIAVDVGLKRDGLVPREDIKRLLAEEPAAEASPPASAGQAGDEEFWASLLRDEEAGKESQLSFETGGDHAVLNRR
jgi:ribosomal protein S1